MTTTTTKTTINTSRLTVTNQNFHKYIKWLMRQSRACMLLIIQPKPNYFTIIYMCAYWRRTFFICLVKCCSNQWHQFRLKPTPQGVIYGKFEHQGASSLPDVPWCLLVPSPGGNQTSTLRHAQGDKGTYISNFSGSGEGPSETLLIGFLCFSGPHPPEPYALE